MHSCHLIIAIFISTVKYCYCSFILNDPNWVQITHLLIILMSLIVIQLYSAIFISYIVQSIFKSTIRLSTQNLNISNILFKIFISFKLRTDVRYLFYSLVEVFCSIVLKFSVIYNFAFILLCFLIVIHRYVIWNFHLIFINIFICSWNWLIWYHYDVVNEIV